MTDEALRAAYDTLVASRSSGNRESCPPPDALQSLVEREGTEPDRLNTLDHVMSCADCKREFELLRAIHVAHERSRKMVTVPWLLAAAAAVAVIAGVFAWRPGLQDGDSMRSSVSQPGAPIRPSGNSSADVARLLVWHGVPGAPRYAVELIAGERVIFADTVRDTIAIVPGSVALEPGDYVWSVRVLLPGSEGASRSRRFTVSPP